MSMSVSPNLSHFILNATEKNSKNFSPRRYGRHSPRRDVRVNHCLASIKKENFIALRGFGIGQNLQERY